MTKFENYNLYNDLIPHIKDHYWELGVVEDADYINWVILRLMKKSSVMYVDKEYVCEGREFSEANDDTRLKLVQKAANKIYTTYMNKENLKDLVNIWSKNLNRNESEKNDISPDGLQGRGGPIPPRSFR